MFACAEKYIRMEEAFVEETLANFVTTGHNKEHSPRWGENLSALLIPIPKTEKWGPSSKSLILKSSEEGLATLTVEEVHQLYASKHL